MREVRSVSAGDRHLGRTVIYRRDEAHRRAVGLGRASSSPDKGRRGAPRPSSTSSEGGHGRHLVGVADRSSVARLASPISAIPDLPSSVPAMVRSRSLREGCCCAEARSKEARGDRGRGGFHRRDIRSRKKGGPDVGKCRAGKATKVMAIADSDGFPLSVAIAGGNRHDVVLTDRTLDAAFVNELPPRLIGDKAWDSAPHAAALREERNIELIAPKRLGAGKRKQDGRSLRRYRRRWKVERLFAWLKQFRRIATRWDRKSSNYLGFLHLACAAILLRQF